MQEKRVMREVLIEGIHREMQRGEEVYFLSGDFGAIALDKIRADFPDNFINVGIAEQNLLNIATGMALEGFKVYAYAIAPFFLRAYEQIRNLAITAQVRPLDVNLIGVGAGLSYEVSGPTHHCLEDLNVFYTLPNLEIFSPADGRTVEMFLGNQGGDKRPRYLRLDGKPAADIECAAADFQTGFREISRGEGVCIVATGFMTRSSLEALALLRDNGINGGLIDVFLLKGLDKEALAAALRGYSLIVTVEEAFANNGALASLVGTLVRTANITARTLVVGFDDRYIFEVGDREFLHRQSGVDKLGIALRVQEAL